MKRNKSRYAVLGILTLGPKSGYDIKKFFDKSVANFWSESYGQIYPILKRLASEKLVKKTVQRQEGKPDRHIYNITAKGRKELELWLLTPVGRQIGRHEILLKLIFGCQLAIDDNIRQIQNFSNLQREDLEQADQLMTLLEAEYQDSPAKPYLKLALKFGQHVNKAYIDWAAETLTTLTKMQKEKTK